MITDLLFGWFFSAVTWVLDLAPNITIPDVSSWVASFAVIWERLAWANNFVPVTQLVICIGLVVTFYVVLGSIRFVVWVLSKVHVLGGGSQ